MAAINKMNFAMIKEKLAEQPILVFFHIGKTGGTTFTSLMRRCIRKKEIFYSQPNNFAQKGRHGIWGIDEVAKLWNELDDEARNKIRWSNGHLHADTIKIFDRPAYYFGFVRNPVDRCISSIFYNKAMHGKDVASIDDFEEIINRQRGSIHANPQTRHIAGADPKAIITSEHLKNAKKNIDNNFIFLAPVERFGAALMVCNTIFNWSMFRLFYTRRNVTRPFGIRDQITNSHRQQIKEINHLDCELYDYACEHFDQLVESLGPKFKKKVRLFEFINDDVKVFAYINNVIERAFIRIISIISKAQNVFRYASQRETNLFTFIVARIKEQDLFGLLSKRWDGKVVLFVHIPKCAGYSIYSLFRVNYGKQSVFIPHMGAEENARSIAGLTDHNKGKVHAVCAHMPYGAHTYFDKSQYITMLRDPVDRVVSSYYFSKNNINIGGHDLIKDNNLDLLAFASLPGLRNVQSRYLMQREFVGEAWDFVDTEDVITDDNMQDIKSRLRDEFIVGVVEDFARSLKLFRKKLGWTTLVNIRANVTGKRPVLSDIDDEVIAQIKKLNSRDVELYTFAKELFAAECKSAGV